MNLADLQKDGQIWERYGIEDVQYEDCLIAPGESYVQELDAHSGQTLLYEYLANRNFEIIVENGKQKSLINFQF